MLTVLLIAPERNGWTAAIIRTWPIGTMERTPLRGLKAQSKTDRCSGLRPGAPSIVSRSSTKATISSTWVGRVAELPEGTRDRVVHDLEVALADQLLVLDEGDVRLDAGRVAIHHEGDRAGRREEGCLRIAVAVLLTERVRLVPQVTGGAEQVCRNTLVGDARCCSAVLLDHAHERRPVPRELDERTAVVAGDDGALAVRLGRHHRGDRGGVGLPVGRVVGQAAAHEQGAEVRVPQAQRPEAVAVLLDLRRRVARVVDEDLLGGDGQPAAVAEGVHVELAVLAHERHQVQRCEVAAGVVQEAELAAGVRRVLAIRVRDRVPGVDGRVVLDPRVTADVGRLGHAPEDVAGRPGVHGRPAHDRVGGPVAAGLHRAHEVIRHPNGVVRVLEGDRRRTPRP